VAFYPSNFPRLNSCRNPNLDLSFQPANSARAEGYLFWECALGDVLINGRAAQPDTGNNFGQAQNSGLTPAKGAIVVLKICRRHNSSFENNTFIL
jgi:hypothetical protein